MSIKAVRGPLIAVVVMISVLFGLVPSAAASEPGLAMDPDAGPPGTSVTVDGSGFCAAAPCSPVSIEFNGVPLIQGIHVAPSGNFQVTIKVPGDTNAGSSEVVAFQATSPSPPQGRQAVTYFAVSPSAGAPKPDHSPTTSSSYPFPTTTSPSVGARTSTTLSTSSSTTVATGTTTIPRAPKRSSSDPAETLVIVILVLTVSMAAALAGLSYRRRRARRP